ncbi:nuclear factor erythroid 2-related factor 1/3 [Mytilus galloprovincialis]|nr:nuclear factor erythroid 2-related factor 1/3 [Mytilus galloprovincialis]
MLKDYFVDGLVQIAIVLSLLRTDLNNYMNIHYVNYPEVQEIILGSSAALAPTNFINNNINSFYGSGNPKSIYSDLTYQNLIQDLRSLRRFSVWQRSHSAQQIETFLVGLNNLPEIARAPAVEQNNNNNVQSETNTDDQSEVESSNSNQNLDSNDNVQYEEVVLGVDSTCSTSSSVSSSVNSQYDFQFDGLSREDLDLIEVLWRQDIDLGIGKEVFDINLRKELEREREIEIQKEQIKKKEEELLRIKLEEQRRQQEQQWRSENFTRDGETGEWVPVGGRNRIPPPPQTSQQLQQVPQQQNVQNGQYQNYMPYENTMPVMNEMPQSSGEYMMPTHVEPQYQSLRIPHENVDQQQTQQQNMTNFIPQTNYNQTNPYNQGESFEERWQDIVSMLNLSQNNSGNMFNGMPQSMHAMMGHNASMYNQSDMSSPLMQLIQSVPAAGRDNQSSAMLQNITMPTAGDNQSSVLLQNASMPVPPMNNSMNPSYNAFDNSGTCQQNGNFTPSNPDCGMTSQRDFETGDLLFLNDSSPMNQTESLKEVEELLPDIINTENLTDYNITEMALNDGLRSMHMLDEESSESGVSMGSSGSPVHDNFSDSVMSPFDGAGGATGGQDYGESPNYKGPNFNNNNNNNKNYNGYNNSDSQSNCSSVSNDTDYQIDMTRSKHIHHNHSYPVQPGQEPKEYKKYTFNNDKPKQKGPHCRDKKRIAELNIPLTLDQVIESPVEEFNEILQMHKFSDQQLQLIRDIRRRGKNKVAAQNCRKRKMDVIVDLEDNMSSLRERRDRLLEERHMIDKQAREMKDKFGVLYREIFQSLRDENGRPYDPQFYSLQQSSDGNVFLVPRNMTADEQQAKLNKKVKKEKEK